MSSSLIHAQNLADSFIALGPTDNKKNDLTNSSRFLSGQIQLSPIPMEIQLKLSEILGPNPTNDKYKKLFNGDLSMHGNDHSSADLALTRYLAKKGLTHHEVDSIFRASKLFRTKWDEKRGAHTYGEKTLTKAFEDIEQLININLNSSLKDPSSYRPTYHPLGMPPRQFVGPVISLGTRLFPLCALSSLVALGGVGKTSVLLSIACHVAAGKVWNGHALEQKKVALFLCEETQEEIDRKFSSIVDEWDDLERAEAENNLIAVSFLGQDARLTQVNGKTFSSSGMSEQIIQLLKKQRLKDGLVIIDHTQGFASGDLNSSETSTSICLEANKIVEATGAAVVLTAHVSKSNIKSEGVEQGFAVGSLAFENATRQMSGITHMSVEQAKKFGLEAQQKDYVLLGVAKNSYGAITDGLWLKKVFNKKFNTVTFEPTNLEIPIPAIKLSANLKLGLKIKNYLSEHPFTTKNNLDTQSGKGEIFDASKGKIRDILKSLIDTGEVFTYPVTDKERENHNIPKQVKEVLRVK